MFAPGGSFVVDEDGFVVQEAVNRMEEQQSPVSRYCSPPPSSWHSPSSWIPGNCQHSSSFLGASACCNVMESSPRRFCLHLGSTWHKMQIIYKWCLGIPEFNYNICWVTSQNSDLPTNTTFSVVHIPYTEDSKNFHVSGYVNKDNYRSWAPNNPYELHQRPLHSAKVTVWSAISFSWHCLYQFLWECGGAYSNCQQRAVQSRSKYFCKMTYVLVSLLYCDSNRLVQLLTRTDFHANSQEHFSKKTQFSLPGTKIWNWSSPRFVR